MSRTITYGLLAVGVSAIALLAISTQIDLDLFREAWADARYIYLVPGVLFLALGAVTRALRWRVLLSGGLSFRRAFSILNVSYLINNIVPFRLGELVRAYLATRATPPVPVLTSASTIIVERLLDLLAVVLFLAFALAAGPVPDWLRAAGLSGGLAAFAGFMVLVLLSRYRKLAQTITQRVTDLVPLAAKFNLPALLDHFLDGLAPLTRFDALFNALLWTAVSWGFSLASGFVLMYTFYDEGSIVATCLYIAAASFAIAVPAVPGSIGTFEFAIVLALLAFGYEDENTATAFAVMVHVVNAGTYIALGAVGFAQEGVTWGQLARGASATRRASEEPASTPQVADQAEI